MDLGSELRQAREHAGLSLSEIAARTKIPLRHLASIENNQFDKVPAGIFLRSFIRTYAREVHVDPEAAIAEYRSMTEPITEFPVESKALPVEAETPSESVLHEINVARRPWGFALVASALLVSLVAVNRYIEVRSANTPKAVLVPPEAPAPIARPTPAQDHCWVRAVVDGQPTLERLLQPGETQSFTAQHDIVLRVGDPAAFSYSVNGLAGKPLGEANEPVTVRFGTDGHASRVS
jgi:transcriptional regulator with XRE-family HTH domain